MDWLARIIIAATAITGVALLVGFIYITWVIMRFLLIIVAICASISWAADRLEIG